MDMQQQLQAMARLAGQDPLEAGDLADMPIMGRVQVRRLLACMQAEIVTAKGEVMTVRRNLLRKVAARSGGKPAGYPGSNGK